MPTLSFDPAEVRRCVLHALASKKWSRGFGAKAKPHPQLIFVHDEGLYLMSNGQPGEPSDDGKTALFVAYARGYNPHTQDRQVVWDKARAAVGGDDFAEYLTLDPAMREIITRGNFTGFKLRVTERSIEIVVEGAK